MWLLSTYNYLRLKSLANDRPSILYYHGFFYYILKVWGYKYKTGFIYTNTKLGNSVRHLTLEFKTIRFKYIGKAYRISKKKKILVLNLHYPTYKYVLWRNIKLYHKKRKRKVFKLKYLSPNNIKTNLYQNLLRWRIPDTYTKRGILNNVFPVNARKQRAATGR